MTHNGICSESIIRRNEDLLSSDIDGEIVMMSIENGSYYGVNPIGSRIWDIVRNPVKVSDIISVLLKEYDVSKDICENDVLTFLNTLYNEHIIQTIE